MRLPITYGLCLLIGWLGSPAVHAQSPASDPDAEPTATAQTTTAQTATAPKATLPPLHVAGSAELASCLSDSRVPQLERALSTCVEQLRLAGYLELSIDTLWRRTDSVFIIAHQGARYALGRWQSLTSTDSTYGPGNDATLSTPKRLDQLDQTTRDHLRQQAQAGHPFVRVRYNHLEARADSLDLVASTWSGPTITYGGVRFGEGAEAPVSAKFLERFLRLEPGRRYRQNEIDDIGRRLRGLSFLELAREPYVTFEGTEAFVYLDARPRRTSRFDFLLGFLPNSANNDGQLLLTGDATLALDNALRRGERLDFNFERLQPQSTEVQLAASYPYLFDSPFGGRVQFGLYRQQEDWLRVNYEAGIIYAFGGADAYELYYEGGVAQALSFDTVRVRTTQRLPNTLDTRRNGFGARLRLDRRDQILDTRRGFQTVIDASASLREVDVEFGIRSISETLARQADSIGGRTAQYRLRLDIGHYVPLGRRVVSYTRLRAASLFGGQTPLRNELYRIGGQVLLRGFDEQSIDAQHYAVATAELRLLLGGGSFLFVFGDQGYLEDPYRFGESWDSPTGFGAGLRLGTGAGALSLTYAYGRRNGAPIDFQRAKIHIGFESRF